MQRLAFTCVCECVMNCGASSTDDLTTRIEAKRTTRREVGAEAMGMGVGWSLGVRGGLEKRKRGRMERCKHIQISAGSS